MTRCAGPHRGPFHLRTYAGRVRLQCQCGGPEGDSAPASELPPALIERLEPWVGPGPRAVQAELGLEV